MATVSTSQNINNVTRIAGENITIDSGAILTIDAQVSADVTSLATNPGSIICITSGKLLLKNTSTTTPIVLTLNTNAKDLRFEKNGIFEARGAMIELGTGNGTSGQSFSLASSPLDVIPYPSYVEVEDAVGSGTYTPWMIQATVGYTQVKPASTFSSLDCGKVFFWNGSTRTLSVGDGTNGNVLTNGVKIRIPNIYIHSATTNNTPTLRSLVDINPSGTMDVECVAFSNAIYFANTTFSKIRCIRAGFAGHFTATSSNGTVELRGFSVSPDTEQNTVVQLFQLNIILGAVIIDRVTTLVGGSESGASKNLVSQLFALTSDDNTPKVTNCSFARYSRVASGDESLASANLPAGTIWENVAAIGGRVELSNSVGTTLINFRHADDLGTAQLSTVAVNGLVLTNCADMRFVDFGNAGVAACRLEICSPDAQSSNISFFNGTYDGGGNCAGLGAGNGSGLSFYNFTLANQRAATNTFIWNSPTTFLSSGANILNCRATEVGSPMSTEACQASVFDLIPCRPEGVVTTFSGASSYAFANLIDPGLTPTTGSVVIGPFGNYDTMTFTNGAQLDQAGGVELFTSGDAIEVESLFAMHGITSFQNAAPTYNYTEAATLNTDTTTAPSGLTFEFRLRTPSGSYGAYQALSGANLSGAIAALSGYDSDVGLYMQLRVTATSTDATRILNQVYVLTNVDNTYVAPDATITIQGADPTDIVRIYRNEGGGPALDTVLYEFTGSGTFSFSAAANFLNEIYIVRYSSSDQIIMSTRSTPSVLVLGDNGVRSLFSGDEIQLAQVADITAIKTLVDTYLDAAISSRLAAIDYTAPDNTNIGLIKTKVDTLENTDLTGIALEATSQSIKTTVEALNNYDDTVLQAKVDLIDVKIDAILVDTNELQTNQGNWITATGFSTHSVADVVTALQAVANDFKVDTSPILSAIAALNDISLTDIESSTVLAKEATLSAIATAIAAIPTTDSIADLTPVLTAISNLNDVTPAEVRAAFNEADFKDKNTEVEIHNWLDSYANKDSFKADVSTLAASAEIAVLNNISAADVWAAASRTLTDKTGFALDSAEYTSIANAVQSAIINEGDGQQVIDAIVTAIGNSNVDEISLVAAIRADMERTGGTLQLVKDKVDTLSNTDLTGIEVDLLVINNGVKKASLGIPHNQDLI